MSTVHFDIDDVVQFDFSLLTSVIESQLTYLGVGLTFGGQPLVYTP